MSRLSLWGSYWLLFTKHSQCSAALKCANNLFLHPSTPTTSTPTHSFNSSLIRSRYLKVSRKCQSMNCCLKHISSFLELKCSSCRNVAKQSTQLNRGTYNYWITILPMLLCKKHHIIIEFLVKKKCYFNVLFFYFYGCKKNYKFINQLLMIYYYYL